MKRIERLILLQFFTYEMESIELGGNIAFIGKNGSGKSALLDAIQIVVNGGHLNYLKLNSRSDVPTKRTLREYCLGVLQEDGSGHNLHARDQANTYITAVIRDDSGEPLTIGVCMHASTTEPTHDVQGLYVARGVELTLADHIEKVGADDAPLEWGDFHNLLKRRSAQVGQQVFTTTKPEAYIKEWLHAAGHSTRFINSQEFLRTFGKTLALKDMHSPDQFVRECVIEDRPIDTRKAFQHIETFHDFRRRIEALIGQIGALGVLLSQYQKIENDYRREATFLALANEYQCQVDCEAIAVQEANERRVIAQHIDKCFELMGAEADVRRKREDVERIRQSIGSDVENQERRLQDASEKARIQWERVGDLVTPIARAVRQLARLPDKRFEIARFQKLAARLDTLLRAALLDQPEALEQAVLECLEAMEAVRPVLEEMQNDAQQSYNSLRLKREALVGQIKHAQPAACGFPTAQRSS